MRRTWTLDAGPAVGSRFMSSHMKRNFRKDRQLGTNVLKYEETAPFADANVEPLDLRIHYCAIATAMKAIKAFLKSHYGHIRLRLVDLNCLGYMALIGALLPFFHRQVPNWSSHVLIHLMFVIAGLEVIRLGERYPQNKILWTMRTLYPVLFISYGWSELNQLVRMFYGSYWATDVLVHADKNIFGFHPTIWVVQLYSPVVVEIVHIFYSGYYFFMPLVVLSLLFQGKREEVLAAFSVVTFTYFFNFILFYAFPALGPQMIPWLEEARGANDIGHYVAAFTRLVQANGEVRGGAFPSSHVSGALVWTAVAWRYNRTLGYVLAPMSVGVGIATVFLGYHHAVDPIFGCILGLITYSVAMSLIRKRREDPAVALQKEHVRKDSLLLTHGWCCSSH